MKIILIIIKWKVVFISHTLRARGGHSPIAFLYYFNTNKNNKLTSPFFI